MQAYVTYIWLYIAYTKRLMDVNECVTLQLSPDDPTHYYSDISIQNLYSAGFTNVLHSMSDYICDNSYYDAIVITSCKSDNARSCQRDGNPVSKKANIVP